MFYTDIKCNPEISLNKFHGLGIDNVIPLDWLGLITITKRSQLIVNATINYRGTDEAVVSSVLEKRLPDLLHLEDTKIFNNLDGLNMLIVPVRDQGRYKVLLVCCCRERTYSQKNLNFINLILKLMYENYMLNNEIIQERNHLQNVLNSTGSGIVTINKEGLITSANRSSLTYFCNENVLGNQYREFFPEDTTRVLQDGIEEVITSKKNTVKEIIFSKEDFGLVALNLSISPLFDGEDEDNIAGVVLVGTDVTKRKILERELEQLNQFAILGEVAAGVAHDIKNPLMSIRGCARILEKHLYNNPKYMEFLKPILYETNRINEVVEQMISYGRITQENSYTMLDVNDVLLKCYNVIRFHRKSKQISFEKKLAGDLPLIKGNNVELQQAFINILLNAVQAIENEGFIKIEGSYLDRQNQVLVSISDNGTGIDDRNVGKVFKPFFSTKSEGMGMGLSIVKRVIKKHGGNISISSKLHAGTRVDVYLSCEGA